MPFRLVIAYAGMNQERHVPDVLSSVPLRLGLPETVDDFQRVAYCDFRFMRRFRSIVRLDSVRRALE